MRGATILVHQPEYRMTRLMDDGIDVRFGDEPTGWTKTFGTSGTKVIVKDGGRIREGSIRPEPVRLGRKAGTAKGPQGTT